MRIVVRQAHVFVELHRGDPQAQHFRAVLLDDLLRLDDVAERLRHRRPSPSSVQPLSGALAVRRAALAARRRPAASCGTSRDTGRRLPDTCRRATAVRSVSSSTARWLDPESNQTSRMSFSLRELRAAALGARRARRACSSAAVRSYQMSAVCSANSFDDAVEDLAIGDRLAAAFAVEHDDRHAPDALARDAPVGPRRRSCWRCAPRPRPASTSRCWIASSARWRKSLRSMPMNHCSVARKMVGLWQRQQCG